MVVGMGVVWVCVGMFGCEGGFRWVDLYIFCLLAREFVDYFFRLALVPVLAYPILS